MSRAASRLRRGVTRDDVTASEPPGSRASSARNHSLAEPWDRYPGARLLIALSLVLMTSCGMGPTNPEIARRVSGVSEERLRADIDALTRNGPRSPKNLPGMRAALTYLKGELIRAGYEVREEIISFDAREATEPLVEESSPPLGSPHRYVNLIAELPGNPGAPILELGAHYDSVIQSVGADDNASGVAGVLEIARMMSGLRLERTVRFCFFCLEEYGLKGSDHHAGQIRIRDELLEGIIVFEMIGYATEQPGSQEAPARIPFLVWPPTVGNFITVVGNISSGGLGNLVEDAAERYVPRLKYYSVNRIGGFFSDAARSDHSPYWTRGYRGIMLTDTANFRNPHYHRETDTPDTLNYKFMREVTQAGLATALEWGLGLSR